jgi:uncharacterized protein YciU (UPF0263 family)
VKVSLSLTGFQLGFVDEQAIRVNESFALRLLYCTREAKKTLHIVLI